MKKYIIIFLFLGVYAFAASSFWGGFPNPRRLKLHVHEAATLYSVLGVLFGILIGRLFHSDRGL